VETKGEKETHVRDVITSKSNQAPLGFDGLSSDLRCVPTGSDEHPLSPNISEELARLSVVVIAARFDRMEVSKVRESLFCLRDKVGEGWFRVFHLHSQKRIPGRDAESNSVLANGLGDRFDDF
jgi:hypothetical protein